MNEMIVATDLRRVRGRRQAGVSSFLGIPFAAPAAGGLRFEAPSPPSRWEGVRECDQFGPPPPQLPPALGVPPVWRPETGIADLTANVWSPELGTVGLPVLVWNHRGRA